MKYLLNLLLISFIFIVQSKCNHCHHEPKLKIYTTRVTTDYPDWIQAPESKRLDFKVLATHITLNFVPIPVNEYPKIEIGLDHFDDATSTIWKNNDIVVQNHKTDFLNGNKFTGFWVTWNNSLIAIGLEGAETPFQVWQDPIPFPINFVGFHTSQGKPGVWIIEE